MMSQRRADQNGANGTEAVFNASSIVKNSEDVRIVLLGRTGSGKSSSGNTILGKNEFPSSLSATAVTRECKRGTCNRFSRRLQVIDTPGLYDTEMSTDISREVARCVEMTAPGPHAFLFVVRVARFTEEEQNAIAYFTELFGRCILDYLIILVTRKDDLMYNGQTIEDYIENDSSPLKSVLKDCGGRYVGFNNRGSDEEKEQDVQTLVEVIDKMVQDNGGQVYTNDMFQEAKKVMQEKEDQLKQEYEGAMKEEKRVEREYLSSTRDRENIKLPRKREIQATRGTGVRGIEVDLREEHCATEKNGSCLKDKIKRAFSALRGRAARPYIIAFGLGALFFVLHRLGLKERLLSTEW